LVVGAEIILRVATETDAQKLFDWRNDPLTRANSIEMSPVPWDDHIRWLAASLTRADRELLIAERDRESVGTVRLDYSDADCELSWTVAPEWRQQSIGKQMVGMAIRRARKALLKAEIKLDNEPSRRIARALGFSEGRHRNGLATWSYTRKDD
jgi:RimJ/RimL family protein N-acetyltransferase